MCWACQAVNTTVTVSDRDPNFIVMVMSADDGAHHLFVELDSEPRFVRYLLIPILHPRLRQSGHQVLPPGHVGGVVSGGSGVVAEVVGPSADSLPAASKVTSWTCPKGTWCACMVFSNWTALVASGPVPTVALEADHADPRAFSEEQVDTRIQAFIESFA